MTLWEFFASPFAFSFMQRALLTALLLGSVCAVLSCFLVLKGWSLMGDAVSHAVLPGIVVAYLVGLPLVAGAFVAGLFCALATGYIQSTSRVKEDTVLGIVFAGLFALGLLMFLKVETDLHLTHVLFGNLLGTTREELLLLAAIAIPVLIVLLAFRQTFMLYVFDPVQAHTLGLSLRFLHFALLALLAATAVAALKAVGVILLVAMLVTPGAIGFLVARRVAGMMLVSWTAAILSSISGVVLSFHLDLPTGPLIVVVQFALFALALLWTQQHGTAGAKSTAAAPLKPPAATP